MCKKFNLRELGDFTIQRHVAAEHGSFSRFPSQPEAPIHSEFATARVKSRYETDLHSCNFRHLLAKHYFFISLKYPYVLLQKHKSQHDSFRYASCPNIKCLRTIEKRECMLSGRAAGRVLEISVFPRGVHAS